MKCLLVICLYNMAQGRGREAKIKTSSIQIPGSSVDHMVLCVTHLPTRYYVRLSPLAMAAIYTASLISFLFISFPRNSIALLMRRT